MADQTLLPGITAERVPTGRLTMAVLSATGRAGQPVLFVHGNVSSSLAQTRALLDGYAAAGARYAPTMRCRRLFERIVRILYAQKKVFVILVLKWLMGLLRG